MKNGQTDARFSDRFVCEGRRVSRPKWHAIFGRPPKSFKRPRFKEPRQLCFGTARESIRLNSRLKAKQYPKISEEKHYKPFDLGIRRVVRNLFHAFWSKTKCETKNWSLLNFFERSINRKNLLSEIITGNETWVFAYDPETKLRLSEWHTTTSPRSKKITCCLIKIEGHVICVLW